MKDLKSIGALNGAVFILMFGVGMIVALLPRKMLDLSDSAFQVGALASAFAIPYIVFQLPIGRLADRYGYKLYWWCFWAFSSTELDTAWAVFGYRLGRPALPDPSDAVEGQMAVLCPLCWHFGFQWPTRKLRQSKT